MSFADELRRRGGQIAVPILGAAVFGYFAYHTVLGDRGLLAYLALEQTVARAQSSVAYYRADRENLELRTQRLRPDSLDLDLLEERVRAVLGRIHEDERVILRDLSADPGKG